MDENQVMGMVLTILIVSGILSFAECPAWLVLCVAIYTGLFYFIGAIA